MPDLFIAQENTNTTPAQIENQPVQRADPRVNVEKSTLESSPSFQPRSFHRPNLFSNFIEYPSGLSFETQEPGETILLFLRRDFITNLPWIFASLLLFSLPFLLNFIPIVPPNIMSSFPPNFMLILKFFYFLAIITYAFIGYTTWYFNVSLVTNIRVLDIDFSDIIYKNVAGTKINLIQDVSFTQVGAIRSVFNYGDVLVQTAGAVDNFVFEAIPRPDHAVQVIESLIGKEKNAV